MDPSVASALDEVYPGINGSMAGFPEFVLIEDGLGGYSHIICHGHQGDVFNKKACNWFGRTVTQAASMLHEVPLLGDLIQAQNGTSIGEIRQTWSTGKENVVSKHPAQGFGYATLNEREIAKAMDRLSEVLGTAPMVCCGHSHDAKLYPGRSEGAHAAQLNYLNTGTAGMAPGHAWFAMIRKAGSIVINELFLARLNGNGKIEIKQFIDKTPPRLEGVNGVLVVT
jgi:hypothetical protein